MNLSEIKKINAQKILGIQLQETVDVFYRRLFAILEGHDAGEVGFGFGRSTVVIRLGPADLLDVFLFKPVELVELNCATDAVNASGVFLEEKFHSFVVQADFFCVDLSEDWFAHCCLFRIQMYESISR